LTENESELSTNSFYVSETKSFTFSTLLQERAIPLILDGKDVVAKGRTGSGKTGAFAIPIIQRLLTAKKTAQEQCTRALVLAPTRELSKQIQEEFAKVRHS
jgi:ATP-dependent RNA helicase DDX56/DBP9